MFFWKDCCTFDGGSLCYAWRHDDEGKQAAALIIIIMKVVELQTSWADSGGLNAFDDRAAEEELSDWARA